VRIRIALTTAVAVTLIPTLCFTLFSGGPASGRLAAGTARQHTTTTAGTHIVSDARAERAAQQAAKLAAYSAAVAVAQQQQFMAYLQANTMPAAWEATALCEEGGRDDPNYGYFGIKAWNGFDGFPRAGSAPLSVQLAWEAAHGQGPPDAPGRCHSY
jgi:hypothetical protein